MGLLQLVEQSKFSCQLNNNDKSGEGKQTEKFACSKFGSHLCGSARDQLMGSLKGRERVEDLLG